MLIINFGHRSNQIENYKKPDNLIFIDILASSASKKVVRRAPGFCYSRDFFISFLNFF